VEVVTTALWAPVLVTVMVTVRSDSPGLTVATLELMDDTWRVAWLIMTRPSPVASRAWLSEAVMVTPVAPVGDESSYQTRA
jgi:hypothetical protein